MLPDVKRVPDGRQAAINNEMIFFDLGEEADTRLYISPNGKFSVLSHRIMLDEQSDHERAGMVATISVVSLAALEPHGSSVARDGQVHRGFGRKVA